MTQVLLHTVVLPGDTQILDRNDLNRAVALSGALEDATPLTQPVSVDPGERLVRGKVRGQYAEQVAKQVDELATGASIGEVAFYGESVTTTDDGYYTVSQANVRRPRPRSRNLWNFDITLRRVGSRKTHWRAVKTNVDNSGTFPFSGADAPEVAVPASATDVRWFDAVNKTYEEAIATNTGVGTQHGNVDEYDTDEPSFASPTLIYQLPYADEGKTDCRVWDTRGNANRLDGSSDLQWQRVFDAGHQFEGDIVVENGHLRLTVDETNQTLTAERWGGSSFSSVSLGTSPYTPIDLDLTKIGLADVRGQFTFRNDGIDYAYDMALWRGYDDALWTVPPNGQPINIDGFERSSPLDEYSGDTGGVTTTTAGFIGTGIEVAGSSNLISIASTSGLDAYPDTGEAWQGRVADLDNDTPVARSGWFAQTEAADPDAYFIEVDFANTDFAIRKRDGGSLSTLSGPTNITVNGTGWNRYRVKHESDGSITAEWFGGAQTPEVTETATDSNLTLSGGIAFERPADSLGSGPYFDHLWLEDNGGTKSPGQLETELNPIASAVSTDVNPEKALIRREAARV